jgi:hypothetical protein
MNSARNPFLKGEIAHAVFIRNVEKNDTETCAAHSGGKNG